MFTSFLFSLFFSPLFDPGSGKFPVTIQPYRSEVTEKFPLRVFRVTFPSSMWDAYPENRKVPCLWFRPRWFSTKKTVILLSWWKSPSTRNIEALASLLALGGLNVLFVPLAYQYGRAPKGIGSGQWTLSPDLDRTYRAMVQSIRDIRRAATWLIQGKYTTPRHLGIMGISLGGFVASLVYAVDKRFHAATILLAGGDLNYLIRFHLKRLSSLKESRAIRQISKKDKRKLARLIQLLDPLNYSSLVGQRGQRVLLINGYFDLIVPYHCGQKLQKAYRAKLITLPSGHYSTLLFLPYLLPRVVYHFHKTLGS